MLDEITATIVNYKTQDLVQTTFEGLLGCYPDLQIILVDNASQDASTTYIEEQARALSNVSAILNRPNSDAPQAPPPEIRNLRESYPGDTFMRRVWTRGNVGHGPALHQAFQLCKTPYLFTLDSDCVILKCGFLEKMLAEFSDPQVYTIGYRYAGSTGHVVKAREWRVHASAALWDVAKYRALCPFTHYGSVSLDNFADAGRKGYKVLDFPVGGFPRRHTHDHDDYVEHLFHGSRKRLKKIPNLRSGQIRPELMLWGIKTEYMGDYFAG